MRIQNHIDGVRRLHAAGAGIVPGQRQSRHQHVHRHKNGQRRRHPGADAGFQLSHALCHQRVAIPHPGHRRNAPEEAIQQVDAPAEVELEAAVIPEHGAEQQLGDGAAHILIRTAEDDAEPEDAALALVLAAPQKDGGQHQSQPPHHAERAPHQARPAHPDTGRDAAEQGLHHITEEGPHHEQPDQVGYTHRLFGAGGRLRAGRCGVGPLDAALDAGGDLLLQPVGALAQLLPQLFQPGVSGGILPHDHHRTDLVQHGDRHADPYRDVEQQRRQPGAEPQQQVVAPADCYCAQHAPQGRILQADIAVQIKFFIGVIPPAAVVHPFQQLRRDPLDHSRDQ